MGYADPETIRMLCCVSKQFRDLIANDPGMKNNRAISLLKISPAEDQDNTGRRGRLLRLLYCHRDKLQRYLEIKITDAKKYSVSPRSGWMELKKIADTLRLYGVISLDMSSPPPSTDIRYDNGLCYSFSLILPNLRDINLSNTSFPSASLYSFSTNCPNLEKITWHNIDCKQSVIYIDGWDMRQATNLKEMYMDGSVFTVDTVEPHEYSELENDEHSDIVLFCQCRTKLERVSIQNAKWFYENRICDVTTVIPQNALIKFVRKAPASLLWFRSDLTKENRMMLRSEQSGIELVN